MRNILIFAFLSILLFSCAKEVESSNETSDLKLEEVINKKFGFSMVELSKDHFLVKTPSNSYEFIEISEKQAKVINFEGEFAIVTIDSNSPQLINIKYENGYERNGSEFLTSFLAEGLEFDTELETRKKIPGESFKECFKREWTDFCDDWSSCIAQAVHPVAVGVAVAIACA